MSSSGKHIRREGHETARERGRGESGQCAVSDTIEWNLPQEKRTGPHLSEDCSSLRTFEAADAAQVDALDVLDVRQVLRQRELAAVAQVDAILAMLRANVADQANDCAGEDACVEEEK